MWKRLCIVLHAVMSMQRLDGGEEPRFVFALGQHDVAIHLPGLGDRPFAHLRGELHGAVVIAVKDDEDGTAILAQTRHAHALA